MKNHSCRQCVSDDGEKSQRRRFLQSAAIAAGGLVLGLERATRANEERSNPGAAGDETFLAFPKKCWKKSVPLK